MNFGSGSPYVPIRGKRRTGSLNWAIAEIADRQHGVVSRDQLRKAGLSDSAISTRVESGHLHRTFRGTFTVGRRGVGRKGRMLAAVLACGEGTVVSHRSATELIGLWGKQSVLIDVIAPRRRGRKIDGIRRHHVRPPAADEVEVRDGIPCTAPPRTLVDMAGQLGSESLRRLVEQAAVLRVLDVAEVDQVLSRGRRRGVQQLRAALAGWRPLEGQRPNLRSLLEARVLPALVEADLPQPICNAKLRIDGHFLEIDMLWDTEKLVIETDGEETHGTRAAFQHDRWRDQLLLAAGYRTARVTWRQIEDEPNAVIVRIERMLQAT